MVTDTPLVHPVLNISIGGSAIDPRPSSFSLITDEGCAWAIARLLYPSDAAVGKAGEEVKVSLSLGGKEHLLFAGSVQSVNVREAYRDLYLADGYAKLMTTHVTPAYRKESAKAILQDTLASAGITKSAITCPAVEIARFSTGTIPASMAITLLIQALEEHGHTGLRFFFDAENTFRFGTIKDNGKNDGETYEFKTGKNIIKKSEGKIEVLPLPIRRSQEVKVDGIHLIACRTDLKLSGSHSRLNLWLREVL